MLSDTVHWMFRLGLISLADDLQILVSQQVNDPDGIQAMINNGVTPCRRYERRIGRIRISCTGIVRTASNIEAGDPGDRFHLILGGGQRSSLLPLRRVECTHHDPRGHDGLRLEQRKGAAAATMPARDADRATGLLRRGHPPRQPEYQAAPARRAVVRLRPW